MLLARRNSTTSKNVTLFTLQKQLLEEIASKRSQKGFSSNEMIVVIVAIGILASIASPIWIPVIEMAEVLIAEKYLLGAVRECQMALINDEEYPTYTLPPQEIGLISTRRFQFPSSGEDGECLSPTSGNILTAFRTSSDQSTSTYDLNINVITGEKTTDGNLPNWLDWWEGVYSPFIPEDDPLLP